MLHNTSFGRKQHNVTEAAKRRVRISHTISSLRIIGKYKQYEQIVIKICSYCLYFPIILKLQKNMKTNN